MRSYLETDYYKLTMKQFVWEKFPTAHADYSYICRSKIDMRPFKNAILKKIDCLNGLGPTSKEISFLKSQGIFKDPFLSALSNFKINTDYLRFFEKNDQLGIHISGPWYDTIDFEVHLLQLISEVYFEETYLKNSTISETVALYAEGKKRLDEKMVFLRAIHEEYLDLEEGDNQRISAFRLFEFGTRRSFSSAWQEQVLATLSDLDPLMFPGTSNVHLAMKYGLTPMGTMAHELITAHLALYPINEAHLKALYNWNDVYQGKAGIALSDTFTFSYFLKIFNLALASLYAGGRHDSGDPFIWGRKFVNHYTTLGINSFSKQGIWSDNLNLKLAYRLWQEFRGQLLTGFGIGTNLTNDLGVPALSQVIKLTHLNGLPLIKISDEPEKVMCENEPYKVWAMNFFLGDKNV